MKPQLPCTPLPVIGKGRSGGLRPAPPRCDETPVKGQFGEGRAYGGSRFEVTQSHPSSARRLVTLWMLVLGLLCFPFPLLIHSDPRPMRLLTSGIFTLIDTLKSVPHRCPIKLAVEADCHKATSELEHQWKSLQGSGWYYPDFKGAQLGMVLRTYNPSFRETESRGAQVMGSHLP